MKTQILRILMIAFLTQPTAQADPILDAEKSDGSVHRTKESAESIYHRGCELAEKGDLNSALDCFNRAAKLKPNDKTISEDVQWAKSALAQPVIHSAGDLERSGDLEDAIKMYKKAIKMTDDNKNARIFLGHLLLR